MYYSQTCSNNHLYTMTTCLRRPMLSLPKPIPIQSLLYKTTICLATTFLPVLSPTPTPTINGKKKKKHSKTATAKILSSRNNA